MEYKRRQKIVQKFRLIGIAGCATIRPMGQPFFQKLLEERGITQSDLARRLGVNKSSVTLWSLRGIPPKRVIEIERETGIPRGELRPDIYPPEPLEAAE